MGVLAQGYLTLGSAGVRPFNLGLPAPATWLDIVVSEKVTSDNSAHKSVGMATSATIQNFDSSYSDVSGGDTFKGNTHVVKHYERDGGGNIVPVLSAKFHSWTATGIKFDVDLPNANYQALIRVGN